MIDGAVVERGEEHGVPTPLHARVVELGERAPSPEALDDLARTA